VVDEDDGMELDSDNRSARVAESPSSTPFTSVIGFEVIDSDNNAISLFLRPQASGVGSKSKNAQKVSARSERVSSSSTMHHRLHRPVLHRAVHAISLGTDPRRRCWIRVPLGQMRAVSGDCPAIDRRVLVLRRRVRELGPGRRAAPLPRHAPRRRG
jgi:hypothetical protein